MRDEEKDRLIEQWGWRAACLASTYFALMAAMFVVCGDGWYAMLFATTAIVIIARG